MEQVRRRSDGGLVIGLFGTLTVAEAELLGGLRGNGATCVGFVIDSSTWVNLPAAARTEADRSTPPSALTLLQGGLAVGAGRRTATRFRRCGRRRPVARRASPGGRRWPRRSA